MKTFNVFGIIIKQNKKHLKMIKVNYRWVINSIELMNYMIKKEN